MTRTNRGRIVIGLVALTLTVLLCLSGCNTVAGLGRDLADIGHALSTLDEEADR